MKDPHLTVCPDEVCGGLIKRKLGVGAGFVFKGSGFYITDYRSESYKAGAKSDSAASTPAAATPAAAAPSAAPSAPASPAAKPSPSAGSQ
jgi:predicted nucleic acid-binding Zn ribbon protein